jgi:uncharacterized protein (TIGR02246 family)
MKNTCLRITAAAMAALLLSACASAPVEEIQQHDAGDKDAIEVAYQNWYTAWENRDYKLATQDYSDDAIWVNAFGMRRVGRQEIEATLQDVFDMEFVMAGKSRTVEKTVKFINPTVALVTSRIERAGQETPSGEAMPTRKTSHLRVFVKSGGRWQIVSHLISDARDRDDPGH